jgi:hypothetical protein
MLRLDAEVNHHYLFGNSQMREISNLIHNFQIPEKSKASFAFQKTHKPLFRFQSSIM